MIVISGSQINISSIASEYTKDSVEGQLLQTMSASDEKYQYKNMEELKFELSLRREIVRAAVDLNNSDLAFATFPNSRCNPTYWIRTSNGGFRLKNGVVPSQAITDIYTPGDQYATECATAMMIVYYKALLSVYGEDLFNKLFVKIVLMDWSSQDPLLKDVTTVQKVKDLLLGDRAYFANPDFDPSHSEWQGENVIVLPDSLYYGHGVGIGKGDKIIKALNGMRKENATRSAYLLDEAGRPNFKKLSNVYTNPPRTSPLLWLTFPEPISRA